MFKERYIIGIDLGTTNSAVSYIDLSVKDISKKDIKVFQIPQLTGPGEISQINILPSFLYLPGDHEISQESMDLPWPSDGKSFVGTFAREQGAKVTNKMVSSAKSWLCHGKVNREAPILPWSAGEKVARISPIDASSAYLKHIKDAWNYKQGNNEELYLENQFVIITVPASFDEVARDLTVEAAHKAGIRNITLLEEPLAAFYSWLTLHEQDWNQFVKPGELILVCDVGGGTTDFTLITLRETDGGPAFERIAVGDHLILGGDNMDLALARYSETRLGKTQKKSLNIQRWQTLCYQCRQTKENILSGLSESKTITLVGEGRKLIADTVSTKLERTEIEKIIVNGFFPIVECADNLSEMPRKGMTEFGLPYAQDPAISRHLIRFLNHHKDDVENILGRKNCQPDLILFNGGSLKPELIKERIRDVICRYFNTSEEAVPQILDNSDHDLAVALGASYYGLVKKGLGVQVGSGSARAFYLGIDLPDDEEVTKETQRTAICLVERSTQEGTLIELHDRKFQVLANQPVSFDLYSSSYRAGDRIGDIITVDDSMTPLPPIQTVIQFGKKAKETSIPVEVEAQYTEVGTLAIWCRSTQSTHKWRLQFQLRNIDQPIQLSDQEVFEESLVEESLNKIKDVFLSRKSSIAPEELVKLIRKTVRRPKEKWPLNFIRTIADQLISLVSSKSRSLDHESLWLNLTGFCLRPGCGDALDNHRIQKLWKFFNEGPANNKNIQVRSEWWVMWRRIAVGLSSTQQKQVLLSISSLLQQKKKKGETNIKVAPQEHMEIWMALANMERLSVKEKIYWGRLLLDELSPKKSRSQYWWSLARIGAREPLYGPTDLVIPPEEAAFWINSILGTNWRNPRPVGAALTQLARLTGDRKRDVQPDVLQRVVEWLTPYDWSGSCIRHLQEAIPMDQQEETVIFGESLPSGLLLRAEESDIFSK